MLNLCKLPIQCLLSISWPSPEVILKLCKFWLFSWVELIQLRLRDLSVSEDWKLRWYIGTYVYCVRRHCRLQVCCTKDDEPSSRALWTFCLQLCLSEFLISNNSFVHFLLPGQFWLIDWNTSAFSVINLCLFHNTKDLLRTYSFLICKQTEHCHVMPSEFFGYYWWFY